MTSCAQKLLSRFSTFQQQQSTIVDNIVWKTIDLTDFVS